MRNVKEIIRGNILTLKNIEPKLNNLLLITEDCISLGRCGFKVADIVITAKNSGDIEVDFHFRSTNLSLDVRQNSMRFIYKDFGAGMANQGIDLSNIQVSGMLPNGDAAVRMRSLVGIGLVSAGGLVQNPYKYIGIYLDSCGFTALLKDFIDSLISYLEVVGVYDICKLWISRVSGEDKHIVGYQNKSIPFKDGIKNAIVLEVR